MANVNHDEAVRKKALAGEYADKIRKRSEALPKLLTKAQLNFLKSSGPSSDMSVYDGLTDAIRTPGTDLSEYISKRMKWLFGAVIAERDREVLIYVADRLQEYPYSISFYRRSFRSLDRTAYGIKLINIIRRFGFEYLADAPIHKILNRELPEDAQAYLDLNSWMGCGYSGWQIAYALDRHDRETEEAVRRILTEENGSGTMTAELIRGVLYSHRADFHELLGKLLLAARLQEGLRQVICENADLGTKEGFTAILQVIDENNLIRFSSVKRAVGVWLGILADEARDLERVSDKSVRLIIDCLGDEALRREYLASEDAMKIYVALWSYGFENIESALEEISRIAESGSRHQLLVAGCFAANLDMPRASNRIAKRVLSLHRRQEDVLAVWLPCLMSDRLTPMWDAVRENRPVGFSDWFDSREEVDGCYVMIKELYSSFSGKTKTFSPCVFPWYEAKLAKSDLAELLCALAAVSGDDGMLDEACGLIKECSSDRRQFYFASLLRDPRTETQRKTAIEGLADRETYTRKTAYEIVSKLTLTAAEYRSIEEYLRFKSSDIRKYVMSLLLRQNDAPLADSVTRLLDSGKEEVRLGGLDMILQLKKDPRRSALADRFTERLRERAGTGDLPSKEKLLIDSILSREEEAKPEESALFSADDKYLPAEFDPDYTELCVSTFRRYFPDSKLPDQLRGEKSGTSILGKLKAAFAENSPSESSLTAAADLLSLSGFIEDHKTDAFINADGETELIGNVQWAYRFTDQNGGLPAAELWQEWRTANSVTDERIVRAFILFLAYKQKTRFAEVCSGFIRSVFGAGFEYGKDLPHSTIMGILLRRFCESVPEDDRTQMATALAVWFVRCVPDDAVLIHAPGKQRMPKCLEMAHLLAHEQLLLVYNWLSCRNDGTLKYTFPPAVASAERCAAAYRKIPKEERFSVGNMQYHIPKISSRSLCHPYDEGYRTTKFLVGTGAYLYAAYRGIITDAQLYGFLLDPENIREAVETVTSVASSLYERGRQIAEHNTYKFVRLENKVKEFLGGDGGEDAALMEFVARVYETLIPVVLSSELSRGDSPGKYTDGIRGIARIYGADWLARILSALGGDTLDRTAYYGWGGSSDRRGTLSYLLSVCIPGENDSADTLREALAGSKIKEKRLIEAALFSPEWIPIIGEYLGIDSFESVCYYFMAHMNEKFDDKRRAMIAKYTPLSEEELNLGAFDVNWFRSAYGSIGEKEFELIYDAAKYISDGAKHSRARKYADACLGKYTVDETERSISDKRNKDLLMAYALIPLDGEDDICRRYLYIQKFRKESKQFGSQRIASEGKAVETALGNLAINAGYSDTMRLILRMETKVIDDSRALLEEQTVDGVSLKIELDANGKAALVSTKDGKRLKSVPAKLKKNETVAALSGMVKSLTEQYRRTRVMLERAMEDSTPFTFGELGSLLSHPVVYPMLKNLVLISGDTAGFLSETGLADDTGGIRPLDPDSEVRIAHPFDLYRLGTWRSYQKYLYDNRITQPFRQVFRELYVKTDEELETCRSLRYAGNQIQPAKTAATLKSRRWVANVEAGLQKVCYRANIVAEIYALADWFSPADIEAPTLEWVCFSDRRTGKDMKIADVPDILFSEIMRDVDLAVSVAHAGGVDPETSHSTVEMRGAILSFVLPMFRIDNVTIENRHAIVKGKIAEYSIHLGSGTVHRIGGAMIPVLPVHSQHRGKVFLPFVDDDPKTAEIISKVLLFAEDDKIKDPMILSAIGR